MDELAKLRTGEEDGGGVGVGESDVGGVERVGELEVEGVRRAEKVIGGGDDCRNLEDGGTVLAGDLSVGVHGLEELQEDARRERRHRRSSETAERDED